MKPKGYYAAKPVEWKDANRLRARAWRAANPEKTRVIQRNSNLRRRYKIAPEHLALMLTVQNNCCAICKSNNPKGNRDWQVDHDHVTKKVRGLLCINCNAALGHVGDSVERLRAMIAYLER